jgi:hypothetical protein
MTHKEWKRLKLRAVLRRTAPSEVFLVGSVLMVGVDTRGTVYPLQYMDREDWSCNKEYRLYNNLETAGLTDHDNWELVLTASQSAKLERQWIKEQEAENRDEDEEHDEDEDAPA